MLHGVWGKPVYIRVKTRLFYLKTRLIFNNQLDIQLDPEKLDPEKLDPNSSFLLIGIDLT